MESHAQKNKKKNQKISTHKLGGALKWITTKEEEMRSQKPLGFKSLIFVAAPSLSLLLAVFQAWKDPLIDVWISSLNF